MFNRVYNLAIRPFYFLFYNNVKYSRSTVFQGRIEITKDGEISFGEDTVICRWSVFRPWGGFIKVGRNCSINSFCHFSGNGGIVIGDNVRIASHCVIVSANHVYRDSTVPIITQGEIRKQITIEDDCWLGAGVKVLAGVTIHQGSVIGAGSVVTKDIPPYSVVVGVPGKVIKKR